MRQSALSLIGIIHAIEFCVMVGIATISAASAADVHPQADPPGAEGRPQIILMPGERILSGTVLDIGADIVKVNTGELEPRLLAAKTLIDGGGTPLKRGDHVDIAINGRNAVVDYHLAGAPTWRRIIKGRLAQPLTAGSEWAVIKTDGGKEEAYGVRPLVRIKITAMGTGSHAVFLIGESNTILDAASGDDMDLRWQIQEWKRSPPRTRNRKIEGTIVKPASWVTIRTRDGREVHYEVRPFLWETLGKVPRGDHATLLLDEEDKVMDVAVMKDQPGSPE